MRKYALFFLLTFGLFAAFGSAASPVFGCVCVPSKGVLDDLKGSHAVFSGKFVGTEYRKIADNGTVTVVTSHQTSGGSTTSKGGQEVLVLKFQVERWWKGGKTREVKIVTDRDRSADGSETITDCDFPFQIGKRYLVFAYRDEDGLKTNVCTRTKLLEKGREDLKALGAGRKPGKT